MKYANDFFVLAKEETMLQVISDRMTETGRCYGMEMNVGEKIGLMRISRQQSPVQIMIDRKQPENVEYLKYLCCVITNDTRCTCGIKTRIAMVNVTFSKKKALFTSKWT